MINEKEVLKYSLITILKCTISSPRGRQENIDFESLDFDFDLTKLWKPDVISPKPNLHHDIQLTKHFKNKWIPKQPTEEFLYAYTNEYWAVSHMHMVNTRTYQAKLKRIPIDMHNPPYTLKANPHQYKQ